MLVEILTFLATHKVVIAGAAATLSEVVVVLVNLRRRLKKQSEEVTLLSEIYDDVNQKPSTFKNLLWSANPINLFRSP